MRAEELKLRSKNLAKAVIQLCRSIDNRVDTVILKKQLIRSSASTASNYRAVCRARSRAEFIAKLSIVIEEVDETLFWLELLSELGLIRGSESAWCLKESEELVKIFASARKTAQQNSINQSINNSTSQ